MINYKDKREKIKIKMKRISSKIKLRSSFNLDPPLYTTISCTVLKTKNSTVQVTVVYRSGSRLNVDLEQTRRLEIILRLPMVADGKKPALAPVMVAAFTVLPAPPVGRGE